MFDGYLINKVLRFIIYIVIYSGFIGIFLFFWINIFFLGYMYFIM